VIERIIQLLTEERSRFSVEMLSKGFNGDSSYLAGKAVGHVAGLSRALDVIAQLLSAEEKREKKL